MYNRRSCLENKNTTFISGLPVQPGVMQCDREEMRDRHETERSGDEIVSASGGAQL